MRTSHRWRVYHFSPLCNHTRQLLVKKGPPPWLGESASGGNPGGVPLFITSNCPPRLFLSNFRFARHPATENPVRQCDGPQPGEIALGKSSQPLGRPDQSIQACLLD